MLEGEPAWVKAGHPTYASNGFVEKGNIVLVDLRSKEKAAKARIARAVSVPLAMLEDRADDIPQKAPVVLYSDNDKEAMKATNRDPKMCWECMCCVKICPQQAMDVRGYADFMPMGASATPMRGSKDIMWTVKFRDGSMKRFKFPIRSKSIEK